nr:ATP-binding cassette domain-containing protein [uncultured Anaerostipes sp.]
MMKEIAIEVSNLCVDYIPYKKTSIQKSLFKKKEKRIDVIHAVQNLSFSLDKGEILGIVGKNGSGKSTLLRTIAGIFVPDSGSIDLKGHSVSLLSIGVGFTPEISGRENIILSGMLLGFDEKTIRDKMERIIEFSELGKFIDYPVRTYSSGMYSKLAFSITATLETDIILIDEVLSVGDERFKKKSFSKMKELISDKNRTVIIVSHSMDTLHTLCQKVLWIDDGVYQMMGDTDTTLKAYKEYMSR